jgi:PKD repeat protein
MTNRIGLISNTICSLTFTFLTGAVLAQSGATISCPNIDFSFGDFTNWSGFTGSCCPITTPTAGFGINRHVITNAPGTDVTQGGVIAVLSNTPPGYQKAARLGNENVGRQAESLRYSYIPDSTSSIFRLYYALALQDPGHVPAQQPRFEFVISDGLGQIIPCSQFSFLPSPTPPGFNVQGNIKWCDWRTFSIDLSAYHGAPVTIEARTGDCSLAGHFGYGYIHGTCLPLAVQTEHCQGDTLVKLLAPSGFETYEWRLQGDASIISTQDHLYTSQTQNLYEVLITNHSGCSFNLTVDANQHISTQLNAGFTTVNGCNYQMNFHDNSSIQNGQIVNWNWDLGDSTTVSGNASSVQHTYSQPGTYNVELEIISNAGCSSKITQQIVVDSLPVADFQINQSCNTQTSFTDLSSPSPGSGNFVAWNWDFGDGQTSNTQNPTHTYAIQGTYSVTLTATALNGCSSSKTTTFMHFTPPSANFVSSVACFSSPTFFFNNSNVSGSGAITAYNWDFGDGITSAMQNPTHTYLTPGIFNAFLAVTTNNGCVDTHYVAVEVLPIPNIQITPSGPTTFCQGNSVNLTASGANSYLWQGLGSSSTLNATQSGIYTVNGTNLDGCSNSASLQVVVNPLPIVAISTQNSTSFCQGDSLLLNAMGAVAYTWPGGETSDSIFVFQSNNYFVTGIDSNGCSASSIPIQITVNALPQVSITPPLSSVVCPGISTIISATGASAYLWSNGDTSSMIQISTPGPYWVTGTDLNGCSDSSAVFTLSNFIAPQVSITSNGQPAFCQGDSIILTATGADNYVWNDGSTGGITTVYNSGNFFVTGTDSNACSDTSAVLSVTVYSLPIVNITPSITPPYCLGDSVTLFASGASFYNWLGGSLSDSILVTNSGTYSVIGTDTNNCTSLPVPMQVVFHIPPSPSIIPLSATTFCSGDSVILHAAFSNFNSWSTGSVQDTIVVYTSQTVYLTSTDSLGCSGYTSLSIQSLSLPSINTSPPGNMNICEGDSVEVTATGALFYSWSNGSISDTSWFSNQGAYFVTGTDSNGCSNTSQPFYLTITPKPLILQQPVDISAMISDDVVFIVQSNSANDFYAWETSHGQGFLPLQNSSDYSGVNTAALTLYDIGQANHMQLFRCIINNDLCTDTSNVAQLLITNLSSVDQSLNSGFSLYPNPASEYLFIYSQNNVSEQCSIIDVAGRIIRTARVERETTRIDIEDLSSGVYFLLVGQQALRFVKK